MGFGIIVAVDRKDGISRDGSIPWDCPKDRKFFWRMVDKHDTVIVGRKTHESMGNRAKEKRVVVTSRESIDGVKAVARSFQEALDLSIGRTLVAGGEQIYVEAEQHRDCDAIILTRIEGDYDCDKHFQIASHFYTVTETVADVSMLTRVRDTPDDRLAHLYQMILNVGTYKMDRTGVGAISQAISVSFHLQHHFPLLTRKRVFWRGVVEELLFFLSGRTDTTELSDKGVRIWEGNTSREFLDARGLTELKEGDYGKAYGYQWRNFGGSGVDQIRTLIKNLKEDPNSRRHVLSAWNPAQLHEMALPPCHMFAQFSVRCERLTCHLTMRSADMFLGLPFNIASYALLTHILAAETGLKPEFLTIQINDAHIYMNHVDQVREYIARDTPTERPTLTVTPAGDIDTYTPEHFKLDNYKPLGSIKAPMAV